MDDIFLDIGRFIVKKQKAAGFRSSNPAAQRRFSCGFSSAPGITARGNSLTRANPKTILIISSPNIKKDEIEFNPFVLTNGNSAWGLFSWR